MRNEEQEGCVGTQEASIRYPRLRASDRSFTESLVLGALCRSGIGIKLVQSNRATIFPDGSAVVASQQPRLSHATGMGDNFNLMLQSLGKVSYSLCLILNHQPPL